MSAFSTLSVTSRKYIPPSRGGPGFFVRPIEILLKKVEGAQLQVEVRVTDERGHILELLLEPISHGRALYALKEAHLHGAERFFHGGRRRELEGDFRVSPTLGNSREHQKARVEQEDAPDQDAMPDSPLAHHAPPPFHGFPLKPIRPREESS